MDASRLAPAGLHQPEALAIGGWSAGEPLPTPSGPVLLAAAHMTLTERQRSALAEQAAALTPDQWQATLRLAETHGLLSLLWYHLANEEMGHLMPPALWESASEAYRGQLLVQ